jgi:hypothetical protein
VRVTQARTNDRADRAAADQTGCRSEHEQIGACRLLDQDAFRYAVNDAHRD